MRELTIRQLAEKTNLPIHQSRTCVLATQRRRPWEQVSIVAGLCRVAKIGRIGWREEGKRCTGIKIVTKIKRIDGIRE